VLRNPDEDGSPKTKRTVRPKDVDANANKQKAAEWCTQRWVHHDGATAEKYFAKKLLHDPNCNYKEMCYVGLAKL